MPKSREIIFISALFLLLTVFLTFPLATHSSTHLAGDQGASWWNAWNMWWMNKSLTELFSNPYQTDYLRYPDEVTLAFQPRRTSFLKKSDSLSSIQTAS
ncbi:MAG: hypothetical protein KAR05_12040 [Candidatus Omnitrophica bacterium]|nr:hypothetical protein [Candidatus Omnitrophota bacterium]